MTAFAPITPLVDETTRAAVAKLARLRFISDAESAADAIRPVTEEDVAHDAGLRRGIEAADRGDVFTPAEMVERFERRIAARECG